MLRALAARRVGGIPVNVSVHYVSQEVKLDETTLASTPVDAVLSADVERAYLMKEAAELDALDDPSAQQQQRQGEVLLQLDNIGAETAPRRALDLLNSLGFSAEMQAKALKDISGGLTLTLTLIGRH